MHSTMQSICLPHLPSLSPALLQAVVPAVRNTAISYILTLTTVLPLPMLGLPSSRSPATLFIVLPISLLAALRCMCHAVAHLVEALHLLEEL
jgi:hypothetical protein